MSVVTEFSIPHESTHIRENSHNHYAVFDQFFWFEFDLIFAPTPPCIFIVALVYKNFIIKIDVVIFEDALSVPKSVLFTQFNMDGIVPLAT